MGNFAKLDCLLKNQAAPGSGQADAALAYARAIASIENAVVVVSDLARGSCKIYCGRFAETLGLTDYAEEDSIWEKKILSMMPPEEQEKKFISELRFFNMTRHRPKTRQNYYLMSKLRMADNAAGGSIDVLHRMYYAYDDSATSVAYAICVYSPLAIDFKGESIAVDAVTGHYEELTTSADSDLLSPRERQVLALIGIGLKTTDIARRLNISPHTVSRHRQEILSRLQVKNSLEACHIAKSMGLI